MAPFWSLRLSARSARRSPSARRTNPSPINPAHDGFQSAEAISPPLVHRWTRTLDGVASSPLIADGRVFVTVGGGQSGNVLHALDAATGATLWSRTLGGTYYWSGIAYEAGRVFSLNGDGLLRAHAGDSGATLWAVLLPGQYSFSSEPTAEGGIVYAGGAGLGGTLYAVSAGGGEVLWTRSVANGDHSSPSLGGGNVHVGYAGPQIYAFNQLTGAPTWHFAGCCSGGGGRTTVYHAGRLYARDGSSGYVIDGLSGKLADGFSAGPAPAFAGDIGLYLFGGTLRAENVNTGSPVWTFSGDGTLSSAPIVVGDVVYIGSQMGKLFALDLLSGRVLASPDLGAAVHRPDEHNVSEPVTGLGAGEGLVVAPAQSGRCSLGRALRASATAELAGDAAAGCGRRTAARWCRRRYAAARDDRRPGALAQEGGTPFPHGGQGISCQAQRGSRASKAREQLAPRDPRREEEDPRGKPLRHECDQCSEALPEIVYGSAGRGEEPARCARLREAEAQTGRRPRISPGAQAR